MDLTQVTRKWYTLKCCAFYNLNYTKWCFSTLFKLELDNPLASFATNTVILHHEKLFTWAGLFTV